MDAIVVRTTERELEDQRVTALRRVGLTEDALEERMRAGRESLDERDAWEEIEAVRFLLAHQ